MGCMHIGYISSYNIFLREFLATTLSYETFFALL